MSRLEKIAVFLLLIGPENGRRVLNLLDDDEIKRIIPEIGRITAVTEETQQRIWREFCALGYQEGMKAADIVDVIRFFAGGSKIRE